jgi:hypothetical protein
MSDSDCEGFFENDWDECGDVAWSEFDWEKYLQAQDDLLHRYLAHYETLRDNPARVDEVASLMGWDPGQRGNEDGATDRADAAEAAGSGDGIDPYTFLKSPVFVATKALYLSLKRGWERIATDTAKVPQPLALALQTSLYRGEEHALLGVQALDFGDYTMAVSLFKRALRELNQTFALAREAGQAGRQGAVWQEDATPRLFDLREIWLRVIHECRQVLERRVDDEG